jgi:hypothetical protein
MLQRYKNLQDMKVREQIKKKDFQNIDKMKQDLNKEEEELKEFFSDLNKKVDEDPTVVSNWVENLWKGKKDMRKK